MDAMLKTLFIALDEQQGNTPEMNAALKAAEPAVRAVRDKMTWEELDGFWSAVMAVGTADVEACFARGFRAGARLMLEVLQGE
ncbi:MAG: hypothetical protein J6A62_05600 [Oscillospiraceae bacterium]|nr:hypothetical protein [Oscillospiraceae bacterium]